MQVILAAVSRTILICTSLNFKLATVSIHKGVKKCTPELMLVAKAYDWCHTGILWYLWRYRLVIFNYIVVCIISFSIRYSLLLPTWKAAEMFSNIFYWMTPINFVIAIDHELYYHVMFICERLPEIKYFQTFNLLLELISSWKVMRDIACCVARHNSMPH